MNTREMLLREGTEILETAEIGEARLDAWLLLEYITGKKICFSQIRFFMTTTNERKPWNTFIIQNNFNFIIQW